MGDGWPSRRRRITMSITFFAVVAAFAITFAVVLLYNPGAATAEDLALLQPGMTHSEVEAILGPPRSYVRGTITAGDPEEVWVYELPGSRWSVTRQDYEVKFFRGQYDSWAKIK